MYTEVKPQRGMSSLGGEGAGAGKRTKSKQGLVKEESGHSGKYGVTEAKGSPREAKCCHVEWLAW